MILDTDVMTLIKISRDDNGVETRTSYPGIACRVENGNNSGPDSRNGGSEVRQGMLILVGPTFTGAIGDYIVVTKSRGVSQPYAEWQIQQVEACGPFGVSHYEVYT